MYDRWKDYHERVLRPQYGEKEIETRLQSIAPDQYRALHEQVKLRVMAYVPELVDHQDEAIAGLLIKAGMFKELRKKVRSDRISFTAVE